MFKFAHYKTSLCIFIHNTISHEAKKRARKSSKMICKRDTKTDASFERPLSLYCFLRGPEWRWCRQRSKKTPRIIACSYPLVLTCLERQIVISNVEITHIFNISSNLICIQRHLQLLSIIIRRLSNLRLNWCRILRLYLNGLLI